MATPALSNANLRSALDIFQSASPTRMTWISALAASDAALEMAIQSGRADLAARAQQVRGDCYWRLGMRRMATECYRDAHGGRKWEVEGTAGVGMVGMGSLEGMSKDQMKTVLGQTLQC